ncbi:hypothetical protein [Isobaculum melis]|uniref:Lipoprotein n=1 Tax=Isobaculum melis TaxID=142588 RepID=A0A1H9SQ29_9LACT|nr:hypothetical protein [Isobaculum melis]SER87041.1 hypothetical protein SAMN04488559_10891 [Isobaculum melis]
MKKNRYTYLLSILCFTFLILSGCTGNNAKKSFLEAMKEPTKEEQQTKEYSFAIANIDFSKETDASLKMGLSMLEKIELSGTNTFDPEENISKSMMTLSLMGSDMTFESITDEAYTYTNIESLQTTYDLMNQMGSLSNPSAKSETAFFGDLVKENHWQGKYIKTSLNAKAIGEDKNEVPSQKDMTALSQVLSKEMYNYYHNLSNKKFKQQGDLLTVELDKNDYQKLSNLLLKTIHSKPEYEAAIAGVIPGIDLDMIDSLMSKNVFSDFKKIDFTITINQKNNASAITLTMSPKDAKLFKSITIEFSSNSIDFEGTPKLPAENQVIPEAEFTETLNQYFVEKHYQTDNDSELDEEE